MVGLVALQAQQPADKELIEYIRQGGQEPSAYILDKFEKYDIILLGEDHAIKDNLNFVAGLIPHLYHAGVTNLGMEFGAAEMQYKLDSLISAEAYHEDLAREMMYYYNVGWAYREYMDIYKAAWEFNKTLGNNKKKFRVLNLSYQYDWKGFTSPRTPDNMRKVFPKGTPDDFRARVVKKELLDKQEKALLLVGSVHAFTRYKMPRLSVNSDDFCDYDDGLLGNRLYRDYPEKVFNILLHYPFHSKANDPPFQRCPGDGKVEGIMALNNNEPVGFDLINSPLGMIRDNSFFQTCYPDFTLNQIFDGYIFLKPFNKLEGCTIDSAFFNNKPWEEIKPQVPDPDWTGNIPDLESYWNRIKAYVDMKSRYSTFYKQE
jgi:hypothetical protein